MATDLVTYLQDHLAGAQFAVSLLHDLSVQEEDADTALLAANLLPAIEEDRATLEGLINALGYDESSLKQAVAWLTQKTGRMKLTLDETVGIFEAVELLTLGVLGKLALWNALRTIRLAESFGVTLDLEVLCERAKKQHADMEQVRLRLAAKAFRAE